MDQDTSRDARRIPERIETVVIGGGQAGLSVGYHLARRGRPFVILDANERIGDAWRGRWDSLRLFTPARYDGLDGMEFPADPDYFPTKDEMADYLETYARHFELPVRSGVRVERLSRNGDGYLVQASDGWRYEADNVVVAIGTHQRPSIPAFADQLDPDIRRFHSSEYKNPSQLREGDVLLVGAGNSGSELAMDLVPHHNVWMSGRSTGAIPFRIDRPFGLRVGVRFVVGFLFRKIITVRTPIGRKARPMVLQHGGPLIRVKPRDLAAAGVQRVPRVETVEDGKPVLEDGRVLDVPNVIWCTGYEAGFSWIDLPVHGELEPQHESGIVPSHPGLYFVGLLFLDSLSSEMINGVGRDADRVAGHLAERMSDRGDVSPAAASSVADWLPRSAVAGSSEERAAT